MVRFISLIFLSLALPLTAKELQPLPPELAAYVLDPAPEAKELLLRKGDRLAICGDSITEQRMYSVILETYLTACLPDLEITSRQYGWSGEAANGFINRFKNDVLRFKPTIATTCYGMNDFAYLAYNEPTATAYRENLNTIIDEFKAAGTRVVIGSSGIIDSVPDWVKTGEVTQQELNLTLAKFRNIALEVAAAKGVAFADIYRPMLLADYDAKKKFGPTFKLAGGDGVHPSWSGQLVMAYGFLKGLGLNGDLGTITCDESAVGNGTLGSAVGENGHAVTSTKNDYAAGIELPTSMTLHIKSSRLTFSPQPGPRDKDDSISTGMALVPFDDELNRFILRILKPKGAQYKVTWGENSNTYTAQQLEAGINLAKEFPINPLSPAFRKIWDAIQKKQEYDTRQIKTLVHGPEGAVDMEATFALTEKARDLLVKEVAAAVAPVDHTLTVAVIP